MRDISTVGANYRWQKHTFSPEDYTKQMIGYSNCAAFTYDVYWEALGCDYLAWNTAALAADKNIQVFYRLVTNKETDEERAELRAKFISLLEPGGIIADRYNGNTGG